MRFRAAAVVSAVALAITVSGTLPGIAAEAPERVTFLSADHKTTLVGYVYTPDGAHTAHVPAVVMMHGRAGAYSTRANGVYDETTLSKRHQAWGRLWAEAGYLAVMVDGFGPRGYPQGFPRFSYEARPEAVNEVTVRPLDAYGALAYLRSRADVAPEHIGYLGWSNGGSAGLVTMSLDAPAIEHPNPRTGFAAALIFYPACALKGQFDEDGYVPYAPVRMFHGTADQETSSTRCAALVERSRKLGGDIAITLYPGATHGFDDPSRKRQRNPANAAATEDAVERARDFFARQLEGR
jgi:dienelactone hydrolase